MQLRQACSFSYINYALLLNKTAIATDTPRVAKLFQSSQE